MFEPDPIGEGKEPSPLGRAERITLLVFALVVGGGMAAELLFPLEPARLSVVVIVLLWGPLLVLHEGGHAVVAAALGWRVEGIVLGFGRLRRRFVVRGVPVELRSVPLEGFTLTAPARDEASRGAHALVYLGGPGIELLLAGLLLAAVGPEAMFSRPEWGGLWGVQCLALAATLGAVLNLIPHSTLRGEREIPNDGLGILVSLLGDRSKRQP